jgi:hypothetical protein
MNRIVLFARHALVSRRRAAQAPAGYAGSGLAFTSESRTGEPTWPAPRLTFHGRAVDSTLSGAMRSDRTVWLPTPGDTAGRMRLSWDEQDWQVFQFALDSGSTTRGTGRAELRFPDGAVHTYTFVITRP